MPALTSIRGLAALWVVAFHMRYEVKDLFPHTFAAIRPVFKSGFLGVDLFFVLSGFVIALNYQHVFQSPAAGTFRRFMLKRFARIYPVYLVTLLFTVCVVAGFVAFDYPYSHMERFTWRGFVQSLTMTQALSYPMPRQWNLVAWSVSAEFLAYLAYPLLAVSTVYLRSNGAKLAALIVTGAVYMWAIQTWLRPSAMELGLFRIAAGFTMGVVLVGLRDALPQWLRQKRLWGSVALLMLVSVPLLYSVSTARGLAAVTWGPVVFTPVIFVLAQAGAQAGVWKNALALYLGRISYSLYMVHISFLLASRALYHSRNVDTSGWPVRLAYVAGIVALMLLCAHLLYTYVEEPARRWMLGRKPKQA